MKRRIKIGIVDYKVGNISSCKRALDKLGFNTSMVNNSSDILSKDIILLPGVGSFDLAMKSLKENNMDKVIKNAAEDGIPIIGICLGMQILASDSTENTFTKGLDLIPGSIKPISKNQEFHIGWNQIKFRGEFVLPLTKYKKNFFYFNHEYSYVGNEKYIVSETSINNNLNIVSTIKNKNILGFQFHPEKSQKVGHQFLEESIMYLCEKWKQKESLGW